MVFSQRELSKEKEKTRRALQLYEVPGIEIGFVAKDVKAL